MRVRLTAEVCAEIKLAGAKPSANIRKADIIRPLGEPGNCRFIRSLPQVCRMICGCIHAPASRRALSRWSAQLHLVVGGVSLNISRDLEHCQCEGFCTRDFSSVVSGLGWLKFSSSALAEFPSVGIG